MVLNVNIIIGALHIYINAEHRESLQICLAVKLNKFSILTRITSAGILKELQPPHSCIF